MPAKPATAQREETNSIMLPPISTVHGTHDHRKCERKCGYEKADNEGCNSNGVNHAAACSETPGGATVHASGIVGKYTPKLFLSTTWQRVFHSQ